MDETETLNQHNERSGFTESQKERNLIYSSRYTDSRYVHMAKSSLLMRAAASGDGSNKLMMVPAQFT